MQLNFYLYDISNYYNIDNKENMIKQVRSISLKGSLIWKNYYDGCTGLSYNGDITFHTLCWINTNEAQSKIFAMILSSVLLSLALIIKQKLNFISLSISQTAEFSCASYRQNILRSECKRERTWSKRQPKVYFPQCVKCRSAAN